MPAGWFIQGTAFHSAVEAFELSGRTMRGLDVIAAYNDAWASEFLRYSEIEPDTNKWLTGGRVKPADDLARREIRGRDQVFGYLTHVQQTPEWGILELGPNEYAIEYGFELYLGGVLVKGYIDQIIQHQETGRLAVRDLKTGSKIPATPLQLGVYDLAIAEDFGFRPGWGDYYLAKNNAPTEMYDLSVYTPELVGDWFSSLEKGIENEVFIPNPGDACRTCGVSLYCSAVGSDMTYNIRRSID